MYCNFLYMTANYFEITKSIFLGAKMKKFLMILYILWERGVKAKIGTTKNLYIINFQINLKNT